MGNRPKICWWRIACSISICVALIARIIGGYILSHRIQLSRNAFERFAILRSLRRCKRSAFHFGRYVDISFSNLIAFLIGMGFPWSMLVVEADGRDRSKGILATAADRFNIAGVICVLIFSFAHFFTHETERIWLFFIPPALHRRRSWIVAASGNRPRSARMDDGPHASCKPGCFN